MRETTNRENLEKLAAYLESLPADYKHFDMETYRSDSDFYATARKIDCGTVACAAGHGPRAGIRVKPDEDWEDYTERVFSRDNYVFDWCFHSGWHNTDNTPAGAAARIRWFLKHGVPANSKEQRWGKAPLCYREPSNA